MFGKFIDPKMSIMFFWFFFFDFLGTFCRVFGGAFWGLHSGDWWACSLKLKKNWTNIKEHSFPAGLILAGLIPAGLIPTGLIPTGLIPACIVLVQNGNRKKTKKKGKKGIEKEENINLNCPCQSWKWLFWLKILIFNFCDISFLAFISLEITNFWLYLLQEQNSSDIKIVLTTWVITITKCCT